MKAFAAVLIAGLLLAGCASTRYATYDDGGRVRIGQGGAKELVDGIEIWSEGTPARPYRVLGMIKDKRNDALIPQAGFRPMIVAQVKKAGGDAAIILAQDSLDGGSIYVPGANTTNYQAIARPTYGGNYQMSGTATSYSSPGYVAPVIKKESTIAIILYVDAPPTEAAASIAPRPTHDEHGHTAADYLRVAEKYDREGDAEMAALARKKAARLAQ